MPGDGHNQITILTAANNQFKYMGEKIKLKPLSVAKYKNI
jgi:hypothetical protein